MRRARKARMPSRVERSLTILSARMMGVCAIRRVAVGRIIWTGGAYLPLRHDRHLHDASSFQSGVSRGRRIASSGILALVSQRLRLTSKPAEPTVDALSSRWQGLSRASVAFHHASASARSAPLTGMPSLHLGGLDAPAPDELPRFGSGNAALQRASEALATPLHPRVWSDHAHDLQASIRLHARRARSTSPASTSKCDASRANSSFLILSVARSRINAHSAASARSFPRCSAKSLIGNVPLENGDQ